VKRSENSDGAVIQNISTVAKGGAFTDTDETLSFFSKQGAVAVRKYKEFVEAGT
jgi:hypothetical protein